MTLDVYQPDETDEMVERVRAYTAMDVEVPITTDEAVARLNSLTAERAEAAGRVASLTADLKAAKKLQAAVEEKHKKAADSLSTKMRAMTVGVTEYHDHRSFERILIVSDTGRVIDRSSIPADELRWSAPNDEPEPGNEHPPVVEQSQTDQASDGPPPAEDGDPDPVPVEEDTVLDVAMRILKAENGGKMSVRKISEAWPDIGPGTPPSSDLPGADSVRRSEIRTALSDYIAQTPNGPVSRPTKQSFAYTADG